MQRPGEQASAHRLGAAQSLTNLMMIYGSSGRTDLARQESASIEELLVPVLSIPALKADAALTLAAVRQNRAEQLRHEGKQAEAIALCTRGLELAEPIHRREPEQGTAKDRVLALHGTRGQCNLDIERYSDAVADYDRLVELCDESRRQYFRVARAGLLAAAGDYSRAASEADDLSAKANLSDLDRFNLALAYGLIAKSGSPGKPNLNAIRRALNHLNDLKEAGFLQSKPYAELLREAPEFESLRQLPEFQKLLKTLK
jgi:hypothetical protein